MEDTKQNFVLKLKKPLKIANSQDFTEIKEIELDLNKLTLLEQCNIDIEYNKHMIKENINVPPSVKKMTVKWHILTLHQLLQKQYPNLIITLEDIEKISWEDATSIMILFDYGFLMSVAEIETDLELYQQKLLNVLSNDITTK